MARSAIRVLLVDDHAVVRSGLRYFLERVADIEVVGEAANGREAVAMTADLAPDVIVMDMKMGEVDGIAATQQIHQRFADVRVLMLTSFVEGELVQQALSAGAIGYLLKDSSSHELVSAIRMANAGAPVLAREATEALVASFRAPPPPDLNLSEREHMVLRLMSDGLSNEQIAQQLVISRNTVRHHVHNILAKLEVANRTEAVSLAVRQHLVS